MDRARLTPESIAYLIVTAEPWRDLSWPNPFTAEWIHEPDALDLSASDYEARYLDTMRPNPYVDAFSDEPCDSVASAVSERAAVTVGQRWVAADEAVRILVIVTRMEALADLAEWMA